MNLTDAEIRLIMLALDNTSVQLYDEAQKAPADSDQFREESDGMDDIWHRMLEELTFREGSIA